MKRFLSISLFVAGLLLSCASAMATITLPKVIGHNMVLQQQKPIAIWGNARAGENITVSFGGQTKTTKADGLGKWMVLLSPMVATEKPCDLVVAGENTITLHDILIGEVWLCSGQSNMEYTMRKNSKIATPDTGNLSSPVKELERAKNPSIRIFLVTSKNLQKPDSTHLGWSVARDSALRSFSAVAYFFAKELYSKIHVPIGMISSAIPGSAIEPWMSAAPTVDSSSENVRFNDKQPGKFFSTMIQPLAPLAIKGFLWYQGETNCFQNETYEYTQKLGSLITGWRKLWADRQLPFYYVQIAPYYYSRSAGKYPLTTETLPRFWEAQYNVMQVPFTGMTVTTGTVKSPDDLHPGYKWEVGRRLAQWPLATDYHLKTAPSGPIYKSMKRVGSAIELSFNYTGKGLTSSDGRPLNLFTIAGHDGIFYPATATISADKVIVHSDKVNNPEQVRFAWDEAADPNFYNNDGLPAMPFRTNPNIHQVRL